MNAWDLSCRPKVSSPFELNGEQLAMLAAAARQAASLDASNNDNKHQDYLKLINVGQQQQQQYQRKGDQLNLGARRRPNKAIGSSLSSSPPDGCMRNHVHQRPAVCYLVPSSSMILPNNNDRLLEACSQHESANSLASSPGNSSSRSTDESVLEAGQAMASRRDSTESQPISSTTSSHEQTTAVCINPDDDHNSSNNDNNNNKTTTNRLTDKRARKKDQNRRAAYNYRRKKMEERDRMLEEEAKLVHRHVRLNGKIARLERKILLILSTKTRRIFDRIGYSICFQCPICLQTCDNIMNLRNHMKLLHYPHLVDKSSPMTKPRSSSSSSSLVQSAATWNKARLEPKSLDFDNMGGSGGGGGGDDDESCDDIDDDEFASGDDFGDDSVLVDNNNNNIDYVSNCS